MTDTSNAVPNPGSDEAIMRGCTCPPRENSRGKGCWGSDGTLFVYTSDCPLHFPPAPPSTQRDTSLGAKQMEGGNGLR